MRDRKTVAMHKEVWERLKNHGRFGEDFGDIIARALDALEATTSTSSLKGKAELKKKWQSKVATHL